MMRRSDRLSWRRLVLAMAAASVLAACTSPDDDDSPTEVTSLTGTITGTILDSNGTALAGVTVRYTGSGEDGATLTATTNEIGQFSMPGVTVTGVAGTSINDANGPITLSLVPPAGYMSATVNVTPEAQTTGSVGGGTIFIDNFNVGMGTVKLPALNTGLSGVLRDSSTGSAVAGASLRLDFKGVEFDQDGATNGVAATYDSGANLSTTSAADGSFSFTGIYADACVQLRAVNLSIQSITGASAPCSVNGASTDSTALNLATTDDGGVINLANVSVSTFVSGDTVAPYVASVDGVVDPSITPAQLESSVGTTFNVRFSEGMNSELLDASQVTVTTGTAPNLSSVGVASAGMQNGNTAVITLASALPASTRVTISITRQSLKDLAGNGIADSSGVAYDSLTTQDLVLSFVTFGSSSSIADAATVAQFSAPLSTTDLAYVTTNALVDTVSAESESIRPALTRTGGSSAYPTTPLIEQLNSSASAVALNALLDAVAPDDARQVDVGTGRVRVTVPANATDFVVWLERANARLDVLFYPVYMGGGNPQATGVILNNGPSYVIAPNGAALFDLVVRGGSATVQPGDVFHIVSRNSSQAQGGSATLALQDVGRPSVALQLLDQIMYGDSTGPSGGGGTVVIPGDAEPATVLLSITPQAADVNDAEDGFINDNWRGTAELQGRSSAVLQASGFATSLATTNRAIGDATGTGAFLANTAPTIGVALTEPGAYTDAAPELENSSVELSGFGVLNNTATEDGGSANLFVARISNIFTLANDSTGGDVTLDITPSIRDLNNVAPIAETRALVQLADRMPPIMLLAFYDGTNFVFRFNEAVAASGQIVLQNCAATIDVAEDEVTQPDSLTFVVPAAVVTAQVADVTTCFTVGNYTESVYTGDNLGSLTAVEPPAGDVFPHGAISYATIPDLAAPTANTWANWDAEGLGIGIPSFAMADIRQ